MYKSAILISFLLIQVSAASEVLESLKLQVLTAYENAMSTIPEDPDPETQNVLTEEAKKMAVSMKIAREKIGKWGKSLAGKRATLEEIQDDLAERSGDLQRAVEEVDADGTRSVDDVPNAMQEGLGGFKDDMVLLLKRLRRFRGRVNKAASDIVETFRNSVNEMSTRIEKYVERSA